MSMTYNMNYGYGIYVSDEKFVKPEYIKHNTLDIFALDLGGVLVDDYEFDNIYKTELFSVDKDHKLTPLGLAEHVGCVLPFQEEPRIFGDTGRTFEDVIASLHAEYGQYLVDGFDFHKHFVKFEVVEFC